MKKTVDIRKENNMKRNLFAHFKQDLLNDKFNPDSMSFHLMWQWLQLTEKQIAELKQFIKDNADSSLYKIDEQGWLTIGCYTLK